MVEKSATFIYAYGGAADLLGINAATLASRLKKLGIRPRDYKETRKRS
jgi:DNA-binding NtrC family response regulator